MNGALLFAGALWAMGLPGLIGSLSARKYRLPTLLLVLLGSLGAVAPVASVKLVPVPGLGDAYVPAGVLLMAASYAFLIGVVERFGPSAGHRAALFATAGQATALVGLAVLTALPTGAPFADRAATLAAVVPSESWPALAALLGFLAGANLSVVLYHMVRVFTGGRHLWLRALLAPVAGGLVETFISLPLGYAGREDLGPWLAARAAAYALAAVILLPWHPLNRALSAPADA